MGPQERRALGSFRKVSKPLMEKKRRARINLSLEQLRGLLEKHYSHQIRKRKLEKADILELSVKFLRSLQPPCEGIPGTPGADYQAGFGSGPQGVRQLAHGHRVPAIPFSTTDSGPPGSPKAAAPPSPGSRRSRPLQARDRSPEGEDSIPAILRAGWSRAPSAQDRLPARSHPLWRPW